MVLDAVEAVTDMDLTGLITPFPSYINRVYEVETDGGERYVAKFYRPGRWSHKALLEEHRFTLDCASEEIPVVAPIHLSGGSTLAEAEGFPFALFPKKAGRLFELNQDEDYLRAGALIARLHAAGAEDAAFYRVRLLPESSTCHYIQELQGIIPPNFREDFNRVTEELLKLISPLFEDVHIQRIHGDCHRGNLLDRPGEGLMVIDFDDMAMGPPIHDLWMLLPGSITDSRREYALLIEGYESFRPFDPTASRLIEPLRAMRILYFLAWCGRQRGDYQFQKNFPGWGSDRFWEQEIQDLTNQLDEIREGL